MLDADLHKTYIDDEHYNSGHGHAYEKYGVDPSVGALVVVRPDHCECLCVYGERGAVLTSLQMYPR